MLHHCNGTAACDVNQKLDGAMANNQAVTASPLDGELQAFDTQTLTDFPAERLRRDCLPQFSVQANHTFDAAPSRIGDTLFRPPILPCRWRVPLRERSTSASRLQ